VWLTERSVLADSHAHGITHRVALDVYGYVSIALYAAVYEYLWPTPGSPWYARRHRGKTLKPGSSKAPGKDHVSSPSKGKGTWREKWGAAAGGLTSRRSTGADQDKGTSLPVPSSSSSSSSSCSCASEWGVPTVTLAVSRTCSHIHAHMHLTHIVAEQLALSSYS
jgi:hypothetical protein